MIISTERLVLREMTEADFSALYEILSDPQTMEHYPAPFSEEKVHQWIARNREHYAENGLGLYAVTLRETGKVIGDCGVTMQRIHGELKPEVGYHIHKAHRRRGYAAEAAAVCMDDFFSRTTFDAVYSYMKYTNAPSCGVALKNGMEFVEEYDDPVNVRTRVYRINRAQWLARRGKREGFERTFDQAASDYHESRPEYPAELYRDLFAYQPVGPHSCVLEIGAGTGKATAPLLDTGCRLTAVESGKNLAGLAEKRFEGRNNFTLHVQTFQDFAAPDESADLVVAATSFHWIPEAYGYPRVYRLLKRGGAFARFAYHAGPDASRPELAREIQAAYARHAAFSGKAKRYGEAEAAMLSENAVRYGFTDPAYRLYSWTKDFSADGYMKLLRTYPDHMALPERERQELFEEIYAAIDRTGGVITVHYTADMQLARKGE